ncbi:SLC13 family permease [Ulvibacterium sp.]|uniref:SLC13 family permease n=1 Tax=Ulvibacterium sp. TaxID=2665914 RepID=UPI002616066E|nr:SLC13 family permease [Ulvibacterium sp.]
MKSTHNVGLWLGIVLFLIVLALPIPHGLSLEGKRMGAIALLMVVWWVTEAIPIYVTAFLPVVLFPVLGVLDSAETTKVYGHNYVLMLLGAFILAKGIEKQNLHRRIALRIIGLLGTDQRRIILGFMVATAFLSMWITNMAVVLIMLPIASSLIESQRGNDIRNFGLALLLGIAYAASIGGTGTLIGTPPNLVFAGLLDKLYPGAPEIGFVDWMKIALPMVVIFIPVIWIYLVFFMGIQRDAKLINFKLANEISRLGAMGPGEKRVLIIFLLTALGWVFRKDLIMGDFVLPGWGDLLGVADYVHDSTVALFGAILLFLIGDGKGKKLMDWKTACNVPWGVAMFLGGGLALGSGFKSTGLAEWMGGSFLVIGNFPEFFILLGIVALIIFITEVNSNTATATIFLPVLAAMGVAASINPLLVMVPATFACSFAFMMPSGTGTNTVIFASGRIRVADMARTGFWLNLICIVLLPLLLYFIILPTMGITAELPIWAK